MQDSAPVAQMNVADGIVAEELVQPLDALANDGRAQVADVQGLCHVGSAVVHNDGLAGAGLTDAEIGSGAHFLQIAAQESVGELQVDEAGHDGVHHGKVRGIQLFSHSLGDHDGSALVLLGGGQCAVALVFAHC